MTYVEKYAHESWSYIGMSPVELLEFKSKSHGKSSGVNTDAKMDGNRIDKTRRRFIVALAIESINALTTFLIKVKTTQMSNGSVKSQNQTCMQ